MSIINGRICSSSSIYGGPVSSSSNYYIQCDGDTLRLSSNRTPSSGTAPGYPGEICWDTNYIYVCIFGNNWARAALSTF